MRPKGLHNGRFAPLAGDYYYDDAVDEAGPLAELLFVRALAFCAAHLTDGFVSDRQVARVGYNLADAPALAQTLVDVGLWDRDDARKGYTVRRWLKWNLSREEISRNRAKDAARKRRGSMKDTAGVDGEVESERNPDGVQTEGRGNPATNTTQHNTTQGSVRPEGAGRTEPFDLAAYRDEQISRPYRSGR